MFRKCLSKMFHVRSISLSAVLFSRGYMYFEDFSITERARCHPITLVRIHKEETRGKKWNWKEILFSVTVGQFLISEKWSGYGCGSGVEHLSSMPEALCQPLPPPKTIPKGTSNFSCRSISNHQPGNIQNDKHFMKKMVYFKNEKSRIHSLMIYLLFLHSLNLPKLYHNNYSLTIHMQSVLTPTRKDSNTLEPMAGVHFSSIKKPRERGYQFW